MMLEGKVALVTGGSRGIGRAIALKFAAEGADVAILYAGNTTAAGETALEIEKLGRRALVLQCDVADLAAVDAAVKETIGALGGIDILVNNAGIVRDKLVLSMKREDFDAVVDTNLGGCFNTVKACYSHFMKKRAGRIINISSVVGLMGNAGQANYATAKAGLIGLTKSVAKELAARGVTCNAIAPGFIETEMTDELSEKAREAMLGLIPAKRAGSAEEVANAALFLASDLAAYITGEVLRVDGGMCM